MWPKAKANHKRARQQVPTPDYVIFSRLPPFGSSTPTLFAFPMKTTSALLGWLFVALSACSTTKPTQNRSQLNQLTPTAQTATGINGVWTFVKNVGAPASADKKIKIILDKHWMFSQLDPTNNITLFHHGGTYLLDGNSYAETIEYANSSTGGYVGQTFKYEVKVDGDTMRLKGPYNEVWTRVK
jgi:uncharacterized protein (DUF2147 family)